MIQVIVDVRVRDWVMARDMVMTVEVDESSVRRLMLYPYVGRTQVDRREMAPMITELDSAIGSGLAILLADELLSQEAEVDCSIDFVDKNSQTLARMDGESEDDSMFVPKEEDEFPFRHNGYSGDQW